VDPVIRSFLEDQWKLQLGPRLGRGAFAEVWQAESPQGVPCAVKISLEPLDPNHPALERELENLRLVCAIGGHPHLVSLFDFAVVGGYLVSRWELAPDGTLADRLRQCQQAGKQGIPLQELLRYMADAAEGIDFLNRDKGILHRDIKPTNLLLFHGRVKVGDLGLAKLAGATTVSHSRVGTLGYLPPEAYEEERLHPTVDLYSLAATYVELRTGRKPFGENPVEIVRRQLAGQAAVEPLLPQEREHVLWALAPKPEVRPQDGARKWVAQLAAALSHHATKTEPSAATSPSPWPAGASLPPAPGQAGELETPVPPPVWIVPAGTEHEKRRGPAVTPELTAVIVCWHCGQQVTVLREQVGRKVRCPHCGALMEVPASAFGLPPEAVPGGSSSYSASGISGTRKSPSSAAVLNYLFWGAGYLYAERGWGLILLVPFLILTVTTLGLFMIVAWFLLPIGIALAWHAYSLILEDQQWGKPSERRVRIKSPSTAATLNYFLWGIGYVYAGRIWGWLVFLASIVIYPVIVFLSLLGVVFPLFWVLPIGLSLLLAWHAHSMVKEDLELKMCRLK